jgi:hypothetical protein
MAKALQININLACTATDFGKLVLDYLISKTSAIAPENPLMG